MFRVQVRPEEGGQLALPDAADQLQVEQGQYPPPLRRLQVGPHVLRLQGSHLLPLELGHDTVLGRVVEEQLLLHRPVQGAVEHGVDAPDGGAAQARVFALLRGSAAAVLLQLPVKVLDLPGGQLVELDLPDVGDGVQLNASAVILRRGEPQVGLGVDLKPQP